jgi:DNA-binding CsgD family transcriptional regulator
MWIGQATTALKDWADKEANKQRVAANKERLESYTRVPVMPKPEIVRKRNHHGVIKPFIPTERILEMVSMGLTQTRVAQILGMSRTAVQSRLTRHKEAN